MSVNKILIAGNAGKEPEIRMFGDRKKATFSVATSSKGYTTKDGRAIPEQVEWHNIVCWNGLANYAEKTIRKGSFVFIEGKVHYSRFTDQAGNSRDITEIVAENIYPMDRRRDGEPAQVEQEADYIPY